MERLKARRSVSDQRSMGIEMRRAYGREARRRGNYTDADVVRREMRSRGRRWGGGEGGLGEERLGGDYGGRGELRVEGGVGRGRLYRKGDIKGGRAVG